MASEISIKEAIKDMVNNYPRWTIGVTDRPAERRFDHDNPTTWYRWRADTEKIARTVEKYFQNKGMKGRRGGLGSLGR